MMRKKIKKELEAALLDLSADRSLGYLAVTAKPELPVRDRVAWYFHRRHPELIAAREYYIKSENNPRHRKKVDLAILEKVSLDPVALVEFKAMIVPDPLSNPEHELMVKLKGDLTRLADITHVPRFGAMLMVHVENVEQLVLQRLDRGVVKYMSNFRRWAKEPHALDEAIENTKAFFERANINVCRPLSVEVGSVWRAWVKLICFILEPR